MASTTMASSNLLTRKLWATEDWMNPGMRTFYGHLFSRGAVYVARDFIGKDARGDELTLDYLNKLTGIPVGEGGTMEGNEEAHNYGYFKMAMNTTRIAQAMPNKGTIEQQRTLVDFPDSARKAIAKRHMELLDTSLFYQLAGADPTSFTLNGTTWSGANKAFVQGHNAVVAPSTSRIVRAAGRATDQALTVSDTMNFGLIDFALEKNASSDQPIESMADGTYDLIISQEQLVDLKQDTSTPVQWFNTTLAMIQGGNNDMLEGNQFMTATPVGTYSGVNIYVAPRVAYGVRSDTSAVITTVRRAVLVGKDAVAFASPNGSTPSDSSAPLEYYSKTFDYDYKIGVEGRMIYGLKKIKASNAEDNGVIVISTYAASHS